jgi:hypothetical protein
MLVDDQGLHAARREDEQMRTGPTQWLWQKIRQEPVADDLRKLYDALNQITDLDGGRSADISREEDLRRHEVCSTRRKPAACRVRDLFLLQEELLQAHARTSGEPGATDIEAVSHHFQCT